MSIVYFNFLLSQITTNNYSVYARDGSYLITSMYDCALSMIWLFVCMYFSSWLGCPCILLLIKCTSQSVMCKGCLRCSMEELSGKFTCSNSCLWNFHSSGQLDEGFLRFESERNVLSVAFIFFGIPIISAWSMVWNT